MWVYVYLAIGSNLGNRVSNIKKSINYLKSTRGIKFERASCVFESPAQGGPKGQSPYLNLAIKIKTILTPFELLDTLKNIEIKLKRKNDIHWGPRTIDLDILSYSDLVLISDRLSIPHPLMHRRMFVLKPLSEIGPDFIHPIYNKTVLKLLRGMNNGTKKIVPFN